MKEGLATPAWQRLAAAGKKETRSFPYLIPCIPATFVDKEAFCPDESVAIIRFGQFLDGADAILATQEIAPITAHLIF